MIDEKLQPGLDLLPAGIFEQLLGIGFIAERDFLETEEGFKHRRPPSCSKQLDIVDAGGCADIGCRLRLWRQLSIDDGVDRSSRSLKLSFKVDLHLDGVEGIEADFDAFAGQMRRSFIETARDEKRRIACGRAGRHDKRTGGASWWQEASAGPVRCPAASAGVAWFLGRCVCRGDRPIPTRSGIVHSVHQAFVPGANRCSLKTLLARVRKNRSILPRPSG